MHICSFNSVSATVAFVFQQSRLSVETLFKRDEDCYNDAEAFKMRNIQPVSTPECNVTMGFNPVSAHLAHSRCD